MDDLDRKILSLLAKNARMPVKEIAEQVALTSPAVSSRIHKLETDGIISGYTVVLNRPADRVYVDALISLSVTPSHRDELVELMQNSKDVLQCYHVTGAYTSSSKSAAAACPSWSISFYSSRSWAPPAPRSSFPPPSTTATWKQ